MEEVGHGREVGNTMKHLELEATVSRILGSDSGLPPRPILHLLALKPHVLASK